MREPAFWWRPSAAGALLAPLGMLYGAIAARRMQKPGQNAGVPVICVGNFTLGGTGKTPTAIAVAQLLSGMGQRPFFLTRGYGGSQQGPHRVTDSDTAADIGDEALLLKRVAPTVVARDRVQGAKLAVDQGATVIVMDDGLQNPSLRKNLALAVIDGPRGVGNGRCFPAGPLRAPLAAQLERVKSLLVIGEPAGSHHIISLAMSRDLSIHYGRLSAEPSAVVKLHGHNVLAFAGIGRPEKFFDTLKQEGVTVAHEVAFGDHHRFSQADASALLARARSENLTLVTTEKDLARMKGDAALSALAEQTVTLPVSLTVDDDAAFAALIRSAL